MRRQDSGPIDRMMPAKGDKSVAYSVAYKVIGLATELSSNEKTVAIAIVQSFNSRTGQCDPSEGRLAKLGALDRRTAMRAVAKLHRFGLIYSVRHGGSRHTNRFQPNWRAFRSRDVEWNAAFYGTTDEANTTDLSPRQCQPCRSSWDKPVTQNSTKNPENESSRGGTSRQQGASADANGHAREGYGVAGTSIEKHGALAGRSRPSAAVARQKAEERLSIQLHRRFQGDAVGYADVLQRIDGPLHEAAITSEMNRPGSALTVITNFLARHPSTPPLPTGEALPAFSTTTNAEEASA